MDKNQLLEEIKSAAKNKLVTKAEIINAFEISEGIEHGSILERDSVSERGSSEKIRVKVTVSEVLQYIGGAVVFFGIALLVANNWDTLNAASRILLTFGSAIVAFGIGFPLFKNDKTKKLGLVFLMISLLLVPVGIATIMDAMNLALSNNWVAALYELIMIIIYWIWYFVVSKKIYIIPLVIFLIALFFTVSNAVISGLSPEANSNFNEYRWLIVGGSITLFAQYLIKTGKKVFPTFFYVFGIITILIAGMALGGYRPSNLNGIIWEYLYPILAFGIMFFGISIKQSKILVMAAVALMIYILKIGDEYFSTGLGWPLALVLAGLLMIGVGYLSFYINQKYIKNTVQV